MAPIVYNLAIIARRRCSWCRRSASPGLAIGVVVGSLGHLLVQVPPLAAIGVPLPAADRPRRPEARQALVLMAPRALGLGASQIMFLVVTSLASTLATASIAAFNVAFTILQIPIGVIGVPLGVVVLPSLSREAATGGIDAFAALLVARPVDARST